MTVTAKTPDEIRCLKAHEKRERKNAWRLMQHRKTQLGMHGIVLISPRGAKALTPKIKAAIAHYLDPA